jgi:hypothetical protein
MAGKLRVPVMELFDFRGQELFATPRGARSHEYGTSPLCCAASTVVKAIPETSVRNDVFWMSWIGFDFLPKSQDNDVQAVICDARLAPNRLD